VYKAFFGLNRNPFELSPDPSFLCPLGRSEEALASIYHAILRRKGFVVLTGEVGTGKTLTVRYLCELWKDRQIPFANVIGPRLSVTDFLTYVTFDLGIKVAEPSKGNLLRALYEFLLAQFEKGLTTVLIVDEAHQLPRAVLEEIRLLTNFETAQEKLLQILLVGQPELDNQLDSFELRQLKQRVAIRCHLEPLSEDETRLYIERRLRLAGASSSAGTIFPTDAVRAIYRYSSGTPRLVNSICEQALVAAYALQLPSIPVEIIDDVASYFRLNLAPDVSRAEGPSPEDEDEQNEPSENYSAAPTAAASPERNLSTDVRSFKKQNEPIRVPVHSALPHISQARPDQAKETASSGIVATQVFSGAPGAERSPEATKELRPNELGIRSAVITSLSSGEQTQPGTPRGVSDAKDKPKTVSAREGARELARTSLRSTVAANLKVPPKGWYRRSLMIAGAALLLAFLFVFTGDWIRLFHSRVLGDSVLNPPRITTALAMAPDVEPGMVNRAGQSFRGPGSQEQGNKAKQSPASSGHSPKPPKSSSSVPSAVSSVLLGSRNDAVPAWTHWDLKVRAAPTLDARAAWRQPNGLTASIISSESPVPPPASAGAAARERGGEFRQAKLLSSVSVGYPPIAQQTHTEGDVIINAIVDEKGKVGDMQVASGPLLLRQAALDALRQWRYEPATLDGQPLSIAVQVTISFRHRSPE
jgi:general secretion pathway protein A